MKTQKVITTNIDDLRKNWEFGLEFMLDDDKDFGWVKDDLAIASKHFGVSEELLTTINNSLNYIVETLVDYLNKDLRDIWKRLDELEQEKVK